MDFPGGTEEVALAQPTRARIFAFLADRRVAASTEEIATALQLHPNGIRRHLERLVAAGLLERRRSQGGPGRPGDRWRIAAGARPGGESPSGDADLARWLARAFPSSIAGENEVERVGHEIGGELVPEGAGDPVETFGEVFAALGFQPVLKVKTDGSFTCKLTNCPYRDSVRENADVICTLHRGITAGLLAKLDPQATLVRFDPRDPDRAGCMVGVSAARSD